jgi:hypothetical protein
MALKTVRAREAGAMSCTEYTGIRRVHLMPDGGTRLEQCQDASRPWDARDVTLAPDVTVEVLNDGVYELHYW